LPFEVKQEKLKDFWTNFIQNSLEVNMYVDAVDTVNKWCLAQIIQRDQFGVTCHYDGWSTKWDAHHRYNNYKVTAFRRFSKLYTGQTKTPLRAEMNKSPEIIRQWNDTLQAYINSDFEGINAYGLTQYLRGALFI
jgi:hypothetical protein